MDALLHCFGPNGRWRQPAERHWVAALLLLLSPVSLGGLRAQVVVPSPEAQIAAALLPLPEALRAGAGVRGYTPSLTPIMLREGSNTMVCTGDLPGDDRFDVRCYDREFLRVIDRSRELRRAGLEGTTADRRLNQEIEEGILHLPDHPTAGYRMLGPIQDFDPETNVAAPCIEKWQSIHFPYRTAEELGLPTTPEGTLPYVMSSGSWWSHVMIEHEPRR